MANKWQSVDICALRAVRLEPNGVPDPGANNLIVTTDIIQIQIETVIEAGTRTTQKNGCGTVCFTRETRDRVIGRNITIDLCSTDAELMELLGVGELLTASGESIGYADPDPSVDLGYGVGIETWSLAFNNDEQMSHPVTGAAAYLRRVWPKMFFSSAGSATIGEGLAIHQVVGKGQANTNYHNGPANDVPLGYDGAYLEFISSAPPAATDGYATLAAS